MSTGSVMRRLTRLSITATLLAVSSCSGCSGDDSPVAAPSPSPAASPTPTPAPTRPPAKPRPTNPLTGLPGTPRGPVIAVKIDNTAPGRPQLGLEAADVVYVELVEAGLTRLVGVYASRYPSQVGPVRSVRTSDAELLGEYGKPALAFSGGAGGPLAALRRSPVVDASTDRLPHRYARLGSRPAPYNLVTDLRWLARSVSRASRVRDVGFRFARRDARLTRARRVTLVQAVIGQTTLTFRWEPRSRRWVQIGPDGRTMRTASGAAVAASNLVVQRCAVRNDPGNVDVNGVPSQYTKTVGRGSVAVFRDGRLVTGRWRRAATTAPTRYLDRANRDLRLRPGTTWVLLQPTGNRLVYR